MKRDIPATVHIATILIMIMIISSIPFYFIYRYSTSGKQAFNFVGLTFIIVFCSILLLIPIFIRKGVNWVRILYLILYTPGLFLSFFNFPRYMRINIILVPLFIFQCILILLGIILLLLPSSSMWFKEIKQQKKAG